MHWSGAEAIYCKYPCGTKSYSSGHKEVYIIIYAVAVVRYNCKRNVHGNRRALQRPCFDIIITPDASYVHVPLPISLGAFLALQEAGFFSKD